MAARSVAAQLAGAQLEQRNDVGGREEGVGDDRAVAQRDRGDHGVGALAHEHRRERAGGAVELGHPSDLAGVVRGGPAHGHRPGLEGRPRGRHLGVVGRPRRARSAVLACAQAHDLGEEIGGHGC